MAQVTLKELEQRVATLEKLVAQLVQDEEPQKEGEPIEFKDWRKAIGKSPGTEFSKKVDEAGRRIREADRRKTMR